MKKVERWLFFLFTALFPLQTRFILKNWSGVFGEWTSAFFYVSDVFLIALIATWFFNWENNKEFSRRDWLLGGFVVLSLASVAFAENVSLAFYAWTRLLAAVLIFFVSRNIFSRFNKKNRNDFLLVMIVGGVLESVVAIGQYFRQASLGLRVFQESPLLVGEPGVASISMFGEKILRGYGLLPHPNILAGFLIFSIFCFFVWYLMGDEKNKLVRILQPAILFILLTGLFMTFSRIPLAVFCLGSFAYFVVLLVKEKELRKRIVALGMLFLVFIFILTAIFWQELTVRFAEITRDQGIGLRLSYTDFALNLIKENPIIGVGEGNFVWLIKNKVVIYWMAQPAHNIYLLIAAQNGIPALIIFASFLITTLSSLRRFYREYFLGLGFFVLTLIYLILGLVDHYFWTIWQGQIMLYLTLAVLASGPHSLKDRAQPSEG